MGVFAWRIGIVSIEIHWVTTAAHHTADKKANPNRLLGRQLETTAVLKNPRGAMPREARFFP
jgi:hypothetical protein